MITGFVEIFWAVMPVIMYLFLFFILVQPRNAISLRRAKKFLVCGLLSPFLILLFHHVFPSFGELIISANPIIVYGYQAFFQVSLIEETAKVLAIWYVMSERRRAGFDLPIGILFYSITCSGGFAISENISYLFDYGSSILFLRASTSLVLHLLTGVWSAMFLCKAFGYKQVLTEKYSKKEKYRNIAHKIKYMLYAIISGSILHSIFDIQLFLPFRQYSIFDTAITLFFGLVVGYFIIKEKIAESVKMREEGYNLDLI